MIESNLISSRHLCLRRFSVVVVGMWMLASVVSASEPMIITSASKQFIVRGRPQTSVFANNSSGDLIYVDPRLLVVTCDRVRQSVSRAMGWDGGWRGTIFVDIRPVRFDNQPPQLFPFRTSDGWRYRLELPDEIDRRRLIESLVEAILREFADGSAAEVPAELPPWLVPGLAAHLMSGELAELALQPNTFSVRDRGNNDPLKPLRDRVQATGALTIDELNWPEFDEPDSPRAGAYRFSAHLFVRELLRLRGGPDALSAALAMLPQHLNWQTAFLRGFQPHFQRMVDVEKWWALSINQLKTRETSVHWTAAQGQRKLEEILLTPMQAPRSDGTVSAAKLVALQTVINDWSFDQQLPLLQTKVNQLQLARVRLTPELTALADGYRAVITQYLQTRTNPRRLFRERRIRAAVELAIEECTALDQQRAKAVERFLAATTAETLRSADVKRPLPVETSPLESPALPAPAR